MRFPSVRLSLSLALLLALGACASESPSEPDGLAAPSAEIGPDAAGFDLASMVRPNFGAKASGSELETPGIVVDGGPGFVSASIAEPNFTADASFPPTVTFLPELKASSQNTTASNSDDITQARAEAYQVYTSDVAQTVELDVQLSAVVVDGATDVSFALADVFVFGGPEFEVFDSSICPNGRLGLFMFDQTYFCGSRLARANLFIPVGDVTLPQTLSFDVAAGALFGVYAVLRANSSGGSADASQTLTLDFVDDSFLSAIDFSGPSTLEVGIDLKPGSDENCVNPKSRGAVPLAIFGSDVVDVTQIATASLSFAGLDLRTRGNGTAMCAIEDVDGDGLDDLVCHFQMDGAALTTEAGVATLSGELLDGTPISGSDAVCLVP